MQRVAAFSIADIQVPPMWCLLVAIWGAIALATIA
jgi:hypothetical protein